MSDYQARIALAREAYQATRPTPTEVKAVSTRVEAQLAHPVNHMRRLMQFLGGGALLGAGVLAALSHAPGSAEPGSSADAALVDPLSVEPTPSTSVAPSLGLPRGWLQPMQLDPDAAGDSRLEVTQEDPRTRTAARPLTKEGADALAGARSKRAGAASEQTGAATPPPDWSQVSTALAAGDSEAAGRVLEGLAASGDADTRAKALLGQAQLAFSRGDRAEAKRLTRAAAAVPGASAAVKAKALRWAARASL